MNAAQIWHRVRLMFGQGVATLVGADTVQAKVFDGEVISNLRRVQPYGFSHKPKAGAQVYMTFVGGDRAAGFALVVGDKRYVMDLLDGEVAIHDDDGNFVKLGQGGVVTVKATNKIIYEAPEHDFIGVVKHNGKVIDSSHTHTTVGVGQPTTVVN